ncbi:MAG: aldehyde dehydrogenase family protein, partial [Acidimicrobiales bacterium]
MSDDYSVLVGGDRAAGGRGTYDIVNPATEEVVGRAPEVSVDEVEAATRAAAEAFPAWSRTSPQHRSELLARLADILDGQSEGLVPLVQAETGATLRVAKTMQVPQTIDRFRRYARGALEPVTIPLPPTEMPSTALAPGGLLGAVVERRPVGVVACITPYNFPLVNMAGKVGPALAMGNTVVVKPAPQDPLAVLRFGDAVVEAGFPPGVVN